MGVEQVFVDYFQRAKEYDSEWKEYNSLPRRERSRTNPPRYDVEMKVLAEILNKERFVSCHSYVASEINMLMKVELARVSNWQIQQGQVQSSLHLLSYPQSTVEHGLN
jgi:hypothetical protein